MNSQPVTLRRHDSINLTTGVVTRSAVATAKVCYPGHREGLAANDLVTLHSLIVCNSLAGHLPLYCRGNDQHRAVILTPDHRSCQH